MSVRPDDARRLGGLYETLRAPAVPAGGGPGAMQAWLARVEADGALAGLISRLLNGGDLLRADVEAAQALTASAGTSADQAQVAAAYELLRDHSA
ncbi:hypothetical protein [Modestobacter sp. SYSU DS0657]